LQYCNVSRFGGETNLRLRIITPWQVRILIEFVPMTELAPTHNPLHFCPCMPADSQCPSKKIYNERGPNRASIIRLASATISSVPLFSRLEGLSANARVDPGAKMEALQPFPTELTSIRYPLYSITVIACVMYAAKTPRTTWPLTLHCTSEARRVGITDDCHVGWAEIFGYHG
jgi:hypothetical protein